MSSKHRPSGTGDEQSAHSGDLHESQSPTEQLRSQVDDLLFGQYDVWQETIQALVGQLAQQLSIQLAEQLTKVTADLSAQCKGLVQVYSDQLSAQWKALWVQVCQSIKGMPLSPHRTEGEADTHPSDCRTTLATVGAAPDAFFRALSSYLTSVGTDASEQLRTRLAEALASSALERSDVVEDQPDRLDS